MLSTPIFCELEARLSGASSGADSALERAGRRVRGAYFTPQPLVELIVREAVRARLEAGSAERLVVLDPACGDGRFLRAAGAELAARGIAAELIGIERDPDFAALARRLTGATIHQREALLDPPALPPADLVVGNPPYQRSIHLADNDPALWRGLRGRYAATSHGEWDLYAAFIEQALAWTAETGQVGLVVPSRWLTAAFARELRGELARRRAVRALVDFGAEQIFDGATTYASVVFLSRRRSRRVAVYRRTDDGWRGGGVDAATLSAEPWRLIVGPERALFDSLADRPTLGDVARIAKGAGTNADKVYLVRPVARRGDRVVARSDELGCEVELEAALLRPVYRGRDVRDEPPPRLCLVPYRGDALIEPDQLADCYPLAMAYFERCRSRLDARERGRFRGPTFYRFGRPQNLAYLADPAPKVIVPDVAKVGRAVLDRGGAFVVDSAYAIRPTDPAWSVERLAAILASPLVGLWLRATGVPLRGGYTRMKTAYLTSLPLPPDGWQAC